MSLDQLIALNDEMTALIRAGVPLERGLIDAGRDIQGRLGWVVGNLGERLQRGERLPDALGNGLSGVPAIYPAVVEAGIRSGRLAKALEGMAEIARKYAEMRRAIGLAFLYPLIVLYLAYGLGLVFLLLIAPRFVQAMEVLGLPPLRPLKGAVGLGEWVAYWGPIPPLLVLALLVVWARSGRSRALDPGFFSQALGRFPVVGSMILYFRAANFADLLALLIEHQVPLDQAVELAGDALGEASFTKSAQRLAISIRSGQEASSVPRSELAAFPPLLVWILTGGRGRGDLADSLRHVSETYRRKAENRGQFLRWAFPAFLILAIGGSAVIVYAMLLFIPLTSLWNELAIPVNQ